jgi:hypothetical protein
VRHLGRGEEGHHQGADLPGNPGTPATTERAWSAVDVLQYDIANDTRHVEALAEKVVEELLKTEPLRRD